jgi:hypothetical protein
MGRNHSPIGHRPFPHPRAAPRARVVTVVVASPRLFVAECRQPGQMWMVNAMVRYGEMAG